MTAQGTSIYLEQYHDKFKIKVQTLQHCFEPTLAIKMNVKGLSMRQRKYSIDLVTHARLLDTKPLATLLDITIKLIVDTRDPNPDPSYFRTLVRKILYLTITKPDLSFAAQALSQYLQQPTNLHEEYWALLDSTCEVTWLQCLLKELQANVPTPILMMCDNASSIAIILLIMQGQSTLKLIISNLDNSFLLSSPPRIK
ncbi:retrovirus-related pol polyprotein from transposon TNT 1-94 [Tanacetum coccineum]|uniref:Retrovirus-related pol polyprotein from transposon TNT 1-94 n=1 Tax=Tanacetum coccineum TaxID=301880 RepID=A0ABQ5A387_9ASTR